MLKKIMLAGIFSLSLHTVGAQAAYGNLVGHQVTVSGVGGMCRTISVVVEAKSVGRARYYAKKHLNRAGNKVIRDYSSTHRVRLKRAAPTSVRQMAASYRATATGQVCFADL